MCAISSGLFKILKKENPKFLNSLKRKVARKAYYELELKGHLCSLFILSTKIFPGKRTWKGYEVLKQCLSLIFKQLWQCLKTFERWIQNKIFTTQHSQTKCKETLEIRRLLCAVFLSLELVNLNEPVNHDCNSKHGFVCISPMIYVTVSKLIKLSLQNY